MSRPGGIVVVDIGNSGLRTAQIRTEPFSQQLESKTQSLPALFGPIHRISWRSSIARQKSTPHDCARFEWDDIEPTDVASVTKFLSHVVEDLEQADSIDPIEWRVSSVHQTALETLLNSLRTLIQTRNGQPHDIHVINHEDVPMETEVDFPEQLGIDRLLAAWGAYISQEWSTPLIVVQAGTAITVDLVSNEGRFCGGAIMPGIPIALRFLAGSTDRLPLLVSPASLDQYPLPGKNTEQAMFAGVTASIQGGLSHLVAQYRSEFGVAIPVVVSGGDGANLAEHLTPPVVLIDQLVLRSLGALVPETR